MARKCSECGVLSARLRFEPAADDSARAAAWKCLDGDNGKCERRKRGNAAAQAHPPPTIDFDKYTCYYQKAIHALAAGHPAAAVPYFLEAIELDRWEFESHRDLGRAYLEQGLVEAAESSFRAAIELNPEDEDARQTLDGLSARRREREAAEALKAALIGQEEQRRREAADALRTAVLLAAEETRQREAALEQTRQREAAEALREAVRGRRQQPTVLPAVTTASAAAKCDVCLEGKKDMVIIPCGHMCACGLCARKLHARGDPCPICRGPIERVCRVYQT